MKTSEYSPEKLQELIVYVAERSAGDRMFGRTKLNKVLFYSDFTAYRSLGRSITGAAYQHLPQGPCPQQILPALRALGPAIDEVEEPTMSGVRRRPVARRAPNLDLFTPQEVAIVDQVLDELAPFSGMQASEISHKTMAWRLTGDRQQIPYGTAIFSQDFPTEEDIEWLEGVVGASVGSAAV